MDDVIGTGKAIFSQTYNGDDLSSWQVAHEMSIRLEDGALVVSDTERHSWHLLRLYEVLQQYSVAPIFSVVGTQETDCVRYDDLFRMQAAPLPDVVKIDVQGFEYEVLLGFGHLLQNCMAIELEAHVVPIYKGQKLLGDLIDILTHWIFSATDQ